jgi:hypothetical protein
MSPDPSSAWRRESERSATDASPEKRSSVRLSIRLYGSLRIRSDRRESLARMSATKYGISFDRLPIGGQRNSRRRGSRTRRGAASRSHARRPSARGCGADRAGASASRGQRPASTTRVSSHEPATRNGDSSLVLRARFPSSLWRRAARRRQGCSVPSGQRPFIIAALSPRAYGRRSPIRLRRGREGCRRARRPCLGAAWGWFPPPMPASKRPASDGASVALAAKSILRPSRRARRPPGLHPWRSAQSRLG